VDRLRPGSGRFLQDFADELAQVKGGSLHFELEIGAGLTIRVSLASAIEVGQAVDDPLDVHADFDAPFEEVGLVEEASGFDLVAIETDKDVAGSGFFAGEATTLIPERALAAQLGREPEIEPAFAFGLITEGSGFLVGTG